MKRLPRLVAAVRKTTVFLAVLSDLAQEFASAPSSSNLQPTLDVERVTGSSLQLSWPSSARDFVLEETEGLGLTNLWKAVADTPTLNGNDYALALEMLGFNRFYRLRSAPSNLPPDSRVIAPALDRTVASDLGASTAFLYTGSNPTQIGVTNGTIEPRRAAVVRGRVLNGQNSSLSGVQVEVVGHPEFGRTLSRGDGTYDFAVNGGSCVTVRYQKAGYAPAHRQVRVPWQDYTSFPDVVLIERDLQVTTIDLSAPIPVQVARGSVSSDADGTRRATLLFAEGTEAGIVMADGKTQPTTQLHVRATEFSVGSNGPAAMPAELPKGVGYTYCVELTADEALAWGTKVAGKDVVFSRPVILYVENFLQLPVGWLVPVGYYDNDRGVWVPERNGAVVRIVRLANGMADLDLDGDGLADDSATLTSLGVTGAERVQLASLYAPGQSLWRVPISHFSYIDTNFGFGPPQDAQAFSLPEWLKESLNNAECWVGLCYLFDFSTIEIQNQVLAEMVPITGTPFRLHYTTGRVPGRIGNYTLDIPVSLDTVPASLKRIDLEVQVVGRTFRENLEPRPHQTYRFTWDGRDAYGRVTQGTHPVSIRVGYVYDGYYQQPAKLEKTFGYRWGGTPVSANRARQEFIMWQEWQSALGGWAALAQGLGGWSLNVHHAYDPVGRILYLGDGSQRRARSVNHVIRTIAGTGLNSGTSIGAFNGDAPCPATAANLSQPRDVAVGRDGSIYVADTRNHRIRRVDPNGIIQTIAGGGQPSDGIGDGELATAASLEEPWGVAVGSDGSLYIADHGQDRIRRVDPEGLIQTVAGGGNPADGLGDNGPAKRARLNRPNGVALDTDGNLFIADTENHRVRRVGPDGTIVTVAGTSLVGLTPDATPAIEARLSRPTGIAVAPDGSLVIADAGNKRIQRVRPDGKIATVAGGGSRRPEDGSLASQVSVDVARVTVAPDGSVLFSGSNWGSRIYRVDAQGIITVAAGPKASEVLTIDHFVGDGSSAVGAEFRQPQGLAVAPDGTLYVADWMNHVVRGISLPLPGFGLGDLAIPSEDGGELYQFDFNGRHLRTLLALTGSILYRFRYDAGGRLVAVEDGNQNVTTVERALDGTPTKIVAPFGHLTSLELDAAGYLSRVTNPLTNSFRFTYAKGGLLVNRTDPHGQWARFTYDERGRLIKDENAGCCASELVRTETHGTYSVRATSAERLESEYLVGFLPSGQQQRLIRFPDGTTNVTQLNTDSSQATTYADRTIETRSECGDPRFGMQAPVLAKSNLKTPEGLSYTETRSRIAQLANPGDPLSLQALTNVFVVNGRTNQATFNVSSRTATLISSEGRRTTHRLDDQGRVTDLTIPGLSTFTWRYDGRGRLAELSQGERELRLGYDADTGWVRSVTNSENQVTRFECDAGGKPTALVRADQTAWEFEYDAANNLVALTEPRAANRHAFTYAWPNLLETYRSPMGAQERFAYDKDRRLTRREFPSGQSIQFLYSSKGQLTTLQVPEGSHSFSYDAKTGLMTEVVSREGQRLAYSYDGSLVTRAIWSGVVNGTVRYAYDHDLRLTQISYGDLTLTNGYDRDNLLTRIGSVSVERHPQNGLVTAFHDGAFQMRFTRNEYGEVATCTVFHGPTLFQTTYAYDKLGRIGQKIETINGTTVTWDYAYDTEGQLNTVLKDGLLVEAYAYDAVGNRIAMTNALTQQVLRSGDLTHDADHKLLKAGDTTYTYDLDGRLSASKTGASASTFRYNTDATLAGVALPDGRKISYLHDATGRRIARAVNGTRTHAWLYGEGLMPLAEFDGVGTLRTVFIYVRAGGPLALIRDGATFRIVADHLGSPCLVLDVNGAVVKRVDYDTFGNVISDSNPSFDLPFGFAGGLRDPDHELIRFGARDYLPTVGRWTGRDPILFAGGWSLYGYLGNDPVNQVDRSGLQCGRGPEGFMPNARATGPDAYTPQSPGAFARPRQAKPWSMDLDYAPYPGDSETEFFIRGRRYVVPPLKPGYYQQVGANG